MIKKDNRGYVLITSLLLLLILTLVGLSAINTSTLENVMSGNMRLRERNESKCEAGTTISGPVVERVNFAYSDPNSDYDYKGFNNIIMDKSAENDFITTGFDADEILNNPDTAFTMDSEDGLPNVKSDIDNMNSDTAIRGNSIEFASGYEGHGKGLTGAWLTFYRANTTATGRADSEAGCAELYRYKK